MDYNKFALLAGFCLIGACANASGNLIQNGSFEMNDLNAGDFGAYGFDTLSTGSTDITDWIVGDDLAGGTNNGPSTIDYIGGPNPYWTAADGSYSLDLSGILPGSISQDVYLHAGQSYQLTFDLAGNPIGPPATKTELTTFGGYNGTFTFDTTGKTQADMGWELETVDFTATSTGSTQFTFASDDPDGGTSFGPALDNVSLVATPGPLAALPFALGLIRRRRARTA